MIYSPYAVMDIFAIGEVVVGSEKNITEKYATKLLYRQLMTPTTFDANSRTVALILFIRIEYDDIYRTIRYLLYYCVIGYFRLERTT